MASQHDARTFRDILDILAPCCLAVTECLAGTPDPTCVLSERGVCRGVQREGEEAFFSVYKGKS